MTTGPTQPNPYGGKPAVLPPPKENAMGIAGFIVSAIGIITCGVLSIFGVILSAIGLGKGGHGVVTLGNNGGAVIYIAGWHATHCITENVTTRCVVGYRGS